MNEQTEVLAAAVVKRDHIDRKGTSYERLYMIWKDMMRRCEQPSRAAYRNYGGRGIKVCQQWKDYWSFREWAYASGYTEEVTIERVDVNGDYEPNNCKWLLKKLQVRNRRNVKKLTIRGLEFGVPDWAAITGLTRFTINKRLREGWPPEKAVLTPSMQAVARFK